MNGAIKTYSVSGAYAETKMSKDDILTLQRVTSGTVSTFFDSIRGILKHFKDEWGIKSVYEGGISLEGKTEGTFYLTEPYRVDGFYFKYLAFTIEVSYLGFSTSTATRTTKFYIDVYDVEPPAISTSRNPLANINNVNITTSARIDIQEVGREIYSYKGSMLSNLQITRTLNFLFINIPSIPSPVLPQFSGLSANGYGIAKLTNKETDEVYTFIARGNYSTLATQYGYLALYDTENSSRATNVLFPTLINNLVDITNYTVSSDVCLTINVAIRYTLPGGRQTVINGSEKIDKSKLIKNLIQTPSFFTPDNYYTVDGKPYVALYANLLSEFDPNYVFPN